jgi:galactokinase
LLQGDLKTVGECLYASHQGLSQDYEVSCKELDLLVDLTRNNPDVLGARMMGGGFGGCTINLIKKEMIQNIVNEIMKAYQQQTGIEPEAYFVNVGDGVKAI